MKSKILLLGAICLAAIGAAACHHNDDNGSPSTTSTTPPPTGTQTTMQLDTALVLGLASQTSETAAPFAVNNGAVTFTDTSETTAPVAINQP